MALAREAIYAALATRLGSVPGVRGVARRLKPWQQVEPADQPALFLVSGNEVPETLRGRPAKWRISVDVVLYARQDPTSSAPSTSLNTLKTAIETALEPAPGEELPPGASGTTLGGLCSHCWISGPVETGEGADGNQAVVIFPLEILATA